MQDICNPRHTSVVGTVEFKALSDVLETGINELEFYTIPSAKALCIYAMFWRSIHPERSMRAEARDKQHQTEHINCPEVFRSRGRTERSTNTVVEFLNL